MPCLLRPMRVKDVPAVTEIDRAAFPTTWPHTPFQRELSNSQARYLVVQEHRPWEEARDPVEPPAPAQAVPTDLLHRLWRRLSSQGVVNQETSAASERVRGRAGGNPVDIEYGGLPS